MHVREYAALSFAGSLVEKVESADTVDSCRGCELQPDHDRQQHRPCNREVREAHLIWKKMVDEDDSAMQAREVAMPTLMAAELGI